jgi:hypothetical protein
VKKFFYIIYCFLLLKITKEIKLRNSLLSVTLLLYKDRTGHLLYSNIDWFYKYQRDLLPFWEWDKLFKLRDRQFKFKIRYLQDPDNVVDSRATKILRDSVGEKEAKNGDPADKGDVSSIRTDIKKKQDQQVHNLGQRVQTLTTKIAILENDARTAKTELSQWAERVNGMNSFCYAICKKADLFMKENANKTSPFAVRGPAPPLPPGAEGVGSNPNPLSVDIRGSAAQ